MIFTGHPLYIYMYMYICSISLNTQVYMYKSHERVHPAAFMTHWKNSSLQKLESSSVLDLDPGKTWTYCCNK